MAKRSPKILLVRAYDLDDQVDRYRILIDRLWPRGIKKSELRLDEWLKEIAPSTDLRCWFNHLPERWTEFKSRYNRELARNKTEVEHLISVVSAKPVTLVYAARDEEHNHAIVLRDFILARVQRKQK